MIPANKNDIFDALLFVYFRWLTRRSFYTVSARGLSHLQSLPADRPVILFCNHTNWWDGLIAYLLTRYMSHKAIYCMMEEKQLLHYKFFTWLGAFSIDLSSPLRAAAALRYAQHLLQHNETGLWIFPQGKLCAPSEPVEVKPGTDFLARNAPRALLVPIAMRYEFFRESNPRVLIEIGTPFPAVEIEEGRIERECNQAVARVAKSAQTQNLADFEPLYRPRLPINKRWEWIKLAVTGRLREFDPAN